MTMVEKRFVGQDQAEVRVEEKTKGKPEIVGYAAVFYREDDPGTEYELWTDMRERIMPGAFDRAIKEGDDARALFNHDPNQILGRRSAKTLALDADDKGLLYRAMPPKTTTASDVLANIEAGNLQGSSFAFQVTDQEFRTENDVDIREITGVRLYDVGPVTFPAYEATTTGVRSADDAAEARTAYEAWVKEGKPQPKREPDPFMVKVNGWLENDFKGE